MWILRVQDGKLGANTYGSVTASRTRSGRVFDARANDNTKSFV